MAKGYVYKCSECGARGVKLWRQYNTMADNLELLCLRCSEKDQGKELGDSDQIGWLVPAVPTELPNADGCIPKGETFWGYTSVPGWGVKWWYKLPPKIGRECLENLPTREEEEAAKRKGREETDKRHRAHIDETVFVVEATHEEQNNFWLRWHTVLEFEQVSPGFLEQIGSLGTVRRRPVCVSVSWYRIEGKLVAFYEATSTVVDHDMVKEWVEKTFPVIKTQGWRDHHANAANMGHCLSLVAPDWTDDPVKKARSDLIFETLMGTR